MTEEAQNVEEIQKPTEEVAEKIVFDTQSELDSYMDKKLAKALETSQAKLEADYEKRLEEREQKAAKLARMSEAERKATELKDRQEALDAREKEIQMQEYKLQADKELKEKGLPSTLTDLVLSEDVEQTQQRINTLSATINDLVNERVRELARQASPRDGQTNIGTKLSEQEDIIAFANQNRQIKE